MIFKHILSNIVVKQNNSNTEARKRAGLIKGDLDRNTYSSCSKPTNQTSVNSWEKKKHNM